MADQYGTFGSYLADALDGARTFARQYADDKALKAYAANPNDPAAEAALIARNPTAFSQVVNARTGAMNARTAADNLARENYGNSLSAWYLGGQKGPRPQGPFTPQTVAGTPPYAPTAAERSLPSSPSPTSIVAGSVSRPGATTPAAPNGQPMPTAQPGEIVVQAKAPVATPAEAAAELTAINPKAAEQYLRMREHIGTLDEQGRKALADKADTFGNAVPALQQLPYEARRAAIDAYRPTLLQHGWTDAEISDFDPTDQNLSVLLGQAVGAKEILNQQDKAEQRALTRRGQDMTAASAAASRAVTMRGQNMTDARAREQNRIAQAQADNPAVVDYLAQNFIQTGGQLPNLGMKSGPLRAAIVARAQQIAASMGQDGTALAANAAAFGGQKAGARTMGTTGAKVDYGVNEMAAAAPLALSASAALPRGTFVPYNKAVQMLQRGNSDPALKDFVVKTNAMMNAYNVVAGRAGTDVHFREENRRLLSTADSPAAYRAAVNAMRQEGAVAKGATRQTMREVSGGSGGVPADIQAILRKYGH